ncbi:MAG: K+ transport system, NAD-binding component [Haloquadratum sp. J07HQX50]|nr:MAG: K+ transport system, NAD-binding component [Haloquadratum sp. J07HQX50]
MTDPGWRRRLVLSLFAVALVVFVYSLLYQWAIFRFEGVTITIFQSLQTVIEIFTTAGFGGDTQYWNTAPMNLLVIGMNLTGVLLVFLALPVFAIPLFQQAFEDNPQRSAEITDHIIICSYSSRETVLQSELEAADVPYVIIDTDAETVLELNSQGVEAICGDPEREQILEAANISAAQALVADVSDTGNIPVILTAKEAQENLRIISVAENRQDAEYHRYAGADRVIRPRQALGNALGSRATLPITQKLLQTVELSDEFNISEFRVEQDSELAGQTLAELNLQERIGVTVIGVWSNGKFISAPGPEVRIDENTFLLVAGSYEALTEVTTQTVSPKLSGNDEVIVAGYGVVGQSTVETLEESGVSPTVIDMNDDHDRVDVVGDITERETFLKAGIKNTRFAVLAVDDDSAAMYATVAIKESAPHTEMIARANRIENTTKLYRAGARYVLSLSTVTGRMLSSVLLKDEEILTLETQFEIVRTSAPELVGETLQGAAIRDRTGATVVAIERDGELLTNPEPDVRLRKDDRFIVTGSSTVINKFTQTFK